MKCHYCQEALNTRDDYIDQAHSGCIDDMNNQQAGEIAAENAWLVASEAPTNDDLGFEAYESARGLR